MARGPQKRRPQSQFAESRTRQADTDTEGTLNETLRERFSKSAFREQRLSNVIERPKGFKEPAYLVRDYYAEVPASSSKGTWSTRPEVPTANELLMNDDPRRERQAIAQSVADLWSDTASGVADLESESARLASPAGNKKRGSEKKGGRKRDPKARLKAWGYLKEAEPGLDSWSTSEDNKEKVPAEDAGAIKSSGIESGTDRDTSSDSKVEDAGATPRKIKKSVRWGDEASTIAWGTEPDLNRQLKEEPEVETHDDVLSERDYNQIKGPWSSKDKYLKTHWKLLREEAFRTLRDAVAMIRERPTMEENVKRPHIRIYGDTYIRGVTFCPRGFAVRVAFSINRIKKQVQWEQSDRLISGTLVVMVAVDRPEICRTAVVAGRPLALLAKNPPELDLWFSDASEVEIDCTQEWVMVEDRTAYYEGSRHTLQALQKMALADFPLSEHLINAQAMVEPPKYLSNTPKLDLTSIFASPHPSKSYTSVDIVNEWPDNPPSGMDSSQLSAVQRILTKRLALVQGPPGTGKTYVSVQALKVMIGNMKDGDPPVVITCQTNHALDQLLRHVADIHPHFARLGGRSKDTEVIRPRTLYEIRKNQPVPVNSGRNLRNHAMSKINALTEKIGNLLSPLKERSTTIDATIFSQHNILTEAQVQSLLTGKSNFIEAGRPRYYHDPIRDWGGDQIVEAKPKWQPVMSFFDFEEIDPGYEELREEEAENQILEEDDQDFEVLKGPQLMFGDAFAAADKPRRAHRLPDNKAREILAKHSDLWKVHPDQRGAIFQYMLRQLKRTILSKVRELLPEFAKAVQDRKIGNWEQDVIHLRNQKVIGVTTTGLSKYRGMIASLEPKIVLIEEAAETFEGPVIAACLPSVEQLILVGDHRQLRPHCNVYDLEGEPWNLSVSLFERLVEHNDVESTLLRRQRRMIPEVRRLLTPIYGDVIEDHPIVLSERDRAPVPGMGGINSFCFTHMWREEKDAVKSVFNRREAEMVIGMIRYFIFNGVSPDKITVLTFYNGQRRMLLNTIKQDPDLVSSVNRLQVVTVDSYQGEENDIVILSLVRCNDNDAIGFLESENRACVALSRARRGFYIFGDLYLLSRKSSIWSKVIDLLLEGSEGIESRLYNTLPVCCKNHGKVTQIGDPEQLLGLDGGCDEQCGDTLPCGHKCVRKCHPFSHDRIACRADCKKTLECGHTCQRLCCNPCSCPCRDKGEPTMSSREAARLAAEEAQAARDLKIRSSRPYPRDDLDYEERVAPVQWTQWVQNESRTQAALENGSVDMAISLDTGPASTGYPYSDTNPATAAGDALATRKQQQQLDAENERLLFGDSLDVKSDTNDDLLDLSEPMHKMELDATIKTTAKENSRASLLD